MNDPAVTIAGGGLSGLAAALAVARRGRAAHVFERRREVGARFHGDFEGLENWSTEGDVFEELKSLGIAPTFSYAPFRECVFFDPDGRAHVCRSSKPLWYLVRRGTDAGTLDQALKAHALAAGVELRRRGSASVAQGLLQRPVVDALRVSARSGGRATTSGVSYARVSRGL
jgi:flavin-dependent dehydrogenase